MCPFLNLSEFKLSCDLSKCLETRHLVFMAWIWSIIMRGLVLHKWLSQDHWNTMQFDPFDKTGKLLAWAPNILMINLTLIFLIKSNKKINISSLCETQTANTLIWFWSGSVWCVLLSIILLHKIRPQRKIFESQWWKWLKWLLWQ